MTAPSTCGGMWRPDLCWFGRRTDRPVIWLGPAEHGPRHAPIHACEPRRVWLAQQVIAYRAPLSPHPPEATKDGTQP